MKSWVDFSQRYVPQSEEKMYGTHLSWIVVAPVEWHSNSWHKKVKKAMQTYDWTYSWSATGKAAYVRWHKNRHKSNSFLKHCFIPAGDCFTRIANCSWWEWTAGSTLFFWKWSKLHRIWARDGQPHYQTGDLPKFTKRQCIHMIGITLGQLQGRLHMSDGTKTVTSPTLSSNIASYPRGTVSLE